MRSLTRVARKATRQAEMIGPDPLAQLHALASLGRDVEREMDAEIIRARQAGAEWADIGQALGVTKQGAQARHKAASARSGR